MKKLLILFYLITLLSLPNKAYCNDKPTDIRTTYSVGESFCTNVPKHSLIKSEIEHILLHFGKMVMKKQLIQLNLGLTVGLFF
jgi:hypothetical protein